MEIAEMAMNSRQRFWTIAAILHFALVICGAAYVDWTGASLPLRLLGQYSNVSGADNTYSFFAPAVASQCRATLTVRDVDGQEREEALVKDTDSIFNWRAGAILDSFPVFPDKLRRGLSACWAGVIFGRDPAAEEVTMDVKIEDLPTMAEWRTGKRSAWAPVYKASFCRKEAGRGSNPQP